MKYRIKYNSTEVVSAIPLADDAEVLGTACMIMAPLAEAKIMLAAIGVDTALLQEITEPEEE